MTLKDIEREAIALPEHKRAGLICKLLDSLPPADTVVSDDEVAKREREMDNGSVETLTHEEFVRRVRKERRR